MVLVQDITDRKRVEAERERVLVRARGGAPAGRGREPRQGRVPRHRCRTSSARRSRRSSAGRPSCATGGCPTEQHDAARSARSSATPEPQAQLIDDLLDVSRIVSGKLALDACGPSSWRRRDRRRVEVMRPAADAKGVALERDRRRRRCRCSATRTGSSRSCGTCSRTRSSSRRRRRASTIALRGGRRRRARRRARHRARASPPSSCRTSSSASGRPTARRRRAARRARPRARDRPRTWSSCTAARCAPRAAGEGPAPPFTVELPAAAAATPCRPTIAPVAVTHGAAPSLGGLRVLVVDDEPATARRSVGTLLASCGAEVRTAIVGARGARDRRSAGRPTSLVSDIAMPGEDGYALLARCAPARRAPAATSR